MYDYDTSNETSTAVFAFLAGALIGAGIAMLLAPQSGAETRRILSDYAEKAKDQMNSAIESGKEYVQAGKEYVQGGMERGKEAFQTAQKTTRDQMARQL